MDWRKLVRGFGKTSISAGVLILLFVAYQLWGTGIAEARAQSRLKRSFPAAPPVTAPISAVSPPTTAPPTPPDQAIALIRIPKIGVDDAVVEGVGVNDLEKGPGHYPDSAALGHTGNAAIAGHRTTYGAPFYRLNELKPGDDIFITTRTAALPFDYRVFQTMSVDPSDISVLDPTKDNRLTLTTCTPRFSATQRLVVSATLIGQVDPTPVPVVQSAPAAIPGDTPTPTAGLSGKGVSTLPGVAWGLACAAVWFLAWLIGRKRHKWLAYAVASPVFLVLLFIFFENTARFVPGNI